MVRSEQLLDPWKNLRRCCGSLEDAFLGAVASMMQGYLNKETGCCAVECRLLA